MDWGIKDMLKHEDAEALAEEIDDDLGPEPGTGRGRESRTTYLDCGVFMRDFMLRVLYGGR